ncbi:hypothetical protein ACROYT_G013765 [Oculina patagonica]
MLHRVPLENLSGELGVTKTVDEDSTEAKKMKKEETKKTEANPTGKQHLGSVQPATGFKRTGGLSSVLGQISKKTKMSTLEKSKLDWDVFKDQEGIQEELQHFNKDGYLEKQAFLQRTDEKQFEMERDIRQVEATKIAAEILANFIRRDKDIKGFETNEVEHKLSQYADDTTLILDGSEGSFLRAVAVLDGFHIISGLKVNYEKTKVLWVGSAKEREPIKCDKSEISWVKGKVFALGIWFATDRKTMLRCNYEVRIKKIESVIESWQFRRLSLIGKITIIKSLLVSQLVYILTPLTTSVEALQKVNKMFFDFLWDGKGDKVKRIFITKDYKEGGLKMIDINKFNQSLKVSWIQKYLDPTNDGKWKFVFEDSLKKHGGRDVFTCNLHKDDIPTLGVCNPFVQEVLEAWAELHFTDVTDITDVNVGDQIIWYNSLIRINDRPVFHKHWFNHGICKISHLLDENGTLLRYDELRIKFPELKWFESFAVLSAIRSFIRKLHNPQTPDNNIMKGVSLADLTSKSKINHFVYTSLLKREKIPPIGSQVKWLRDLHVQNDCENVLVLQLSQGIDDNRPCSVLKAINLLQMET